MRWPFVAQPLDLHQLEPAVAARRLQRIGTAAYDDRGLRRRMAVDDARRPARRRARQSCASRLRTPVKARCAPFSVRSTPDRSETGGVLSASISSSALS